MATIYRNWELETNIDDGTGVPDFELDRETDLDTLRAVFEPDYGPEPELEIVSVSSTLIAMTVTSIDPSTGLPEASPSAFVDVNVSNLSDIGSVADFEDALDDLLVTGGIHSAVVSDANHDEVFTINFPGTPASNPDNFMIVSGNQSIEFDIGMPNSFEDLFDFGQALITATDFDEFDALTAAEQNDIMATLQGAGLNGLRLVDDGDTVIELTITNTQIVLTAGDYTLTVTGDDLPFSTYWEMVQAMRSIEEGNIADLLSNVNITGATLTGPGGEVFSSLTLEPGEVLTEDTVFDFVTHGNDMDNNIYGEEGNDVLIGMGGNDTLEGGAGDDNLRGSAGDDYLRGGDGADELRGGSGNDVLNGDAGNDTLRGDTGQDQLFGMDGDDRLYGSSGDDFIEGGAGNDRLYGGGGTDTLFGGDGNDRLSGSAGEDYLVGDNGDDQLYGGSGNDALFGGDGDDRIIGGSGNDRIAGEDGDDRLYGGSGNDTLEGGDGNDRLRGNLGDDTLIGDNGNDRLEGGDGNDTLNGGRNNDLLLGQDGNDTLNGGAGGDRLSGSLGNDTIYGETGVDRLYGGGGNDRLYGGSSTDLLRGGAGNDRLNGGAGNDYLYGQTGDDLIYGATGNDRLGGGSGDDVFVFKASHGSDTIIDFDRSDDLIRFIDTGMSFADLDITYSGGNAVIDYGTGTITLEGISGGLDASDFVFV